MQKPWFTSIRNAFISGLLLLAPLAVTWLVFSWLVAKVGGAFRPIFFSPCPPSCATTAPSRSSGTCSRPSS